MSSEIHPLEQAFIDLRGAKDARGLRIRLPLRVGMSIDEMSAEFSKMAGWFSPGSVHIQGVGELIEDSRAQENNLENLILMAKVLKEALKAKRLGTFGPFEADPMAAILEQMKKTDN